MMNKLVIRQVNGQAMLQEVCLGYTAPCHLKVLSMVRQRQATLAEVGMFRSGYGALIRYEQHPLSSRCLR